MKYKKIKYNEKDLVRISKRKALDIVNHPSAHIGETLYTLPILANPNSPWINGFFEIEIEPITYRDSIDYLNEIAEIDYYNCGADLGHYLKFYIESKYLK